MDNRRRTSRAPSAQPSSQPGAGSTNRSSSRTRKPQSHGTTPVPVNAPSSARPSRRQQQTTVPSFSQQISSPFPPTRELRPKPHDDNDDDEEEVLLAEEEVVWSSQLEEINYDDTEVSHQPRRPTGPMLSSVAAGVNPTQDTDLDAEGFPRTQPGPGVSTQIWQRGMGILGDVLEDSLEADEDAAPGAQSKGKGRPTAVEGDHTPTQARVHLQAEAVTSEAVRAGSLTRAASVVSQFPEISGLPGSFEGMSGIGGQNDFGFSQLEDESLPVLQYNSRSTRPLSGAPIEGAETTFDPAAVLVDPVGSQVPAGLHADIVYNRSGNPVSRSSGEPLRPEHEAVLGPVVRSARYEATTTNTVAIPGRADVGNNSQSDQSQSTSSSIRRKKLEFGEYDPADDLISFEYDPSKHGEDPTRDRTGEPTGLKYVPPAPLTAEQEAERARGRKFLFEDDVEGNLEFGREKSRQMVLDRHVRPLKEIRASRAHSSASPSRSERGAAGVSTSAARATGRSTGNQPNPVPFDNPDTQSEVELSESELTWTQMEAISKQYIRERIEPDRRRRAGGNVDDDEESDGMHGIPLAQPPPFPLIRDESDEDVAGATQSTPGAAIPGGAVLVVNSTGSVAGEIEDDSPIAGDSRPPRMSYMQRASQEEAKIGGFHQHVEDEQELDENMEFSFPTRHLEPASQMENSPLIKLFAKKAASKGTEKRLAAATAAISTGSAGETTPRASPSKGKGRTGAGPLVSQPSASSLGVGEGMSSSSKKYPPNQQALMKRGSIRSEFSFGDSSANPSQATQAEKGGLTQPSAVADSRPGHISRYPNPDAFSVSTGESVMRSQVYAGKLVDYAVDQAGLKPGDEGYSAPPADVTYAQWSRKNKDPLSETGSITSTVDTGKGKQPPVDPYAGAFVKIPGAIGRPLSDVDEESRILSTPHVSGESQSVVPDSQEESPPLFMDPPPVPARSQPSAKSSKTVDPRRRLPPSGIRATNVLIASEAGPSRPRPTSPAKAIRQLPHPQTPTTTLKLSKMTTAITIAGTGLSNETSSDSLVSLPGAAHSKTPVENNSLTSSSVIRSIERVDPSLERSDVEAQIEADLVLETQYTEQSSRASSPVLGIFSPEDQAVRQATVLVPATATASQASRISRETSRVMGSFNDETNGGDQAGPSRHIRQEDSVETSVVGTQTTGAAETATSLAVVLSFELPDPPPPAPRVEEQAAKPAPKDTRKVPVAPPPLPPTSEPIRRTRSVTKRQASPPSPRRPMKVPAPPKRLAVATRARTRGKSAVPRVVTSGPPKEHPALDSSPLSSLSNTPEHREKIASPVRPTKTYLKRRTLVGEASTSLVEAPEKPNTSDEQGDPETSASLDPFKTLAKSESKTKTNNAGQKSDPLPAATLGKRARPDPQEAAIISDDEELTPPPSKKRHAETTSKETTKETTSRAKTGAAHSTRAKSSMPPPPARPVSTSYRSCQQGGRVFAPRGKYYYVGTVTDTWQDEEDVTICRVGFDDESTRDLSLLLLYRCELREGDQVRVPGKKGGKLGRAAHVSAVPSWEERNKVSVRLTMIPREEVAVIDGSEMAVDAAVVKKNWKDRKATSLEDIGLGAELIRVQEEAARKEATAKASGRPIPSAAMLGPPRWKSPPAAPPSRAVTMPPRGKKRPPTAIEEPASQSMEKRRRLLEPGPTHPFAGHLFILALAVNDETGARIGSSERTTRKNNLIADIERLGGRVVDGFEDLLNWGGHISDDAARWVWDHGDLKYVAVEPAEPTKGAKRGKHAPGPKLATETVKLFLIADGANRNIKYMMALAAGIPCIDKGWIDDEGGLPWHTYLLPAGQCVSLHHTSSQWVDQTWRDHPRTLGSLLEKPGPVRKSLHEKSILFVYPSRSGTEMEEERFSHTYVYPSLACLMGASRVEAVHDIKAASLKLKEYDAIVYENDNVPEDIQKKVGTKHNGKVICAGFGWVSDCLIAGTFLKLRESE